MQFMFQLLGKAGGGSIDLGDVTVLQVFADMKSEYYEEGEHTVIVYREPCTTTLPIPDAVEMLARQHFIGVILLAERHGARFEGLGIGLGPPVLERAGAVIMTALVVETMGNLVADDRADGAVIDRHV